MRRYLFSASICVSVLLIVPPGSARAARQALVDEQRAVQAIARDGDSPWQVNWNDRAGAPLSIFGSRSLPLAANAAAMPAAVRRLLFDHGDLFQLRPAQDDCRIERTIEVDGIRHFHVRQVFRGLPVIDGGFNVPVDDQGRVVMVTGGAQPNLSGDVAATISPVAAVRIASQSMPGGLAPEGTQPRLAALARGGIATPVYEVPIVGDAPGDAWRITVDARNGAVVDRVSEVSQLTGYGYAYPSYPKNLAPRRVPLLRLLGNGTSLTGQNVSVHSLSSPDVVGVAGNFYRDPGDTLAFSQVHAYYHADIFLNYLRTLGYSNSTPARMKVNDPAPQPISRPSYYSNIDSTIYLSRGYSNAAFDGGVIAHEVTHFVAARLGFTEGGALQEGLAEYFQASYTGDPEIFKYTNGLPAPQCQTGYSPESVQNDPAIFQMPHYDSLYVCGLPQRDSHTNGLIVAGALWDLRSTLGVSLADQLALQAIPFLHGQYAMNCYLDALSEADRLLHANGEATRINQVRASRYLGCRPDPQIVGPRATFIGQPVTFTVAPGTNDCKIVAYSTTTWQRRSSCAPQTCNWITVVANGNSFTDSQNAPVSYELRVCVQDIMGRTDTSDVALIHYYSPLSASISGTTRINADSCETGHWTSSVIGHAPFSYQWSWGGAAFLNGTASTLDFLPTTSPTPIVKLGLTVTDADGQSVSSYMNVSVSGTCTIGGDGPSALRFEPLLSAPGQSGDVTFMATRTMFARLEVCDVAGRRVAVPFKGILQPGTQQVRWKSSALPSGMYFYRLTSEAGTVTRRFTVLH